MFCCHLRSICSGRFIYIRLINQNQSGSFCRKWFSNQRFFLEWKLIWVFFSLSTSGWNGSREWERRKKSHGFKLLWYVSVAETAILIKSSIVKKKQFFARLICGWDCNFNLPIYQRELGATKISITSLYILLHVLISIISIVSHFAQHSSISLLYYDFDYFHTQSHTQTNKIAKIFTNHFRWILIISYLLLPKKFRAGVLMWNWVPFSENGIVCT